MSQFFDIMSDLIMKSSDSERQMKRTYIILFHVFLILGIADILAGSQYAIQTISRSIFATGTVPVYPWVVLISSMAVSIFWILWAQDMQWQYYFKEFKKSEID